MSARLAFATVTASPRPIMLIDELLAVGDEHFQGKCLGRMRQLCRTGKTMIMVSHAMNHVEKFCTHALWLEKGRVRMAGRPSLVCVDYMGNTNIAYPERLAILESATCDVDGGVARIRVKFTRKTDADPLTLQVVVHDSDNGMLAYLFNSAFDNVRMPDRAGRHVCELTFPLSPCARNYGVGVVIFRGTGRGESSDVDSCLGWDNNKYTRFSPVLPAAPAFFTEALSWRME